MAKLQLHVREADGDLLPMVCMVCGEPATIVKTKKMTWYPRWVFLLLLVNILVCAIVGMLLTKRATLRAPLCEEHQGHWFNRQLILWISVLVMLMSGVGVIVLCANASPQWLDAYTEMLCVGGGVLLLAWLILIAIVQQGAIRPTRITDREIALTGVAVAFIDAVAEADRQRRRALYPNVDEEPLHRTSVTDAFEEGPGPRRPGPADAIEE